MPARRAGTQTAKFAIRDNLGHRRDIESDYLAAILTARTEIVIATAYFFPGTQFRRALTAAAERGVKVTLLLQERVEYRLLHYAARALYGQLLDAGVGIEEYHRSFLHAKVAVVDGHWATVGSSNIDPYSLLMAREANVFVRDSHFADQLRRELLKMIGHGARRMAPERWAGRSNTEKALTWIAYGIVRIGMGVMGYGGNEWFPRKRRRTG
jgi:cardiolipin synthase